MEVKFRRKIVNRRGDSGMISIPPVFFDNMEAWDCDEVIMRLQDRNHIVIEVVRGGTQ
jgi:hypothetical protein